MSIKRIVVLGPESSGKTTLCHALASKLNAVVIPEFARLYLEDKGSEYEYEDLYRIAAGQIQLEEDSVAEAKQLNTNPWIIFDTDLQVIRIWSELAFQKCDHRILSEIARRQYDFYLLTYPDLPWAPDPLREHADERQRMRIFHHYYDSLLNQQIPFEIVKGVGEERTDAALRHLLDQFGDIGISS